MHTDRASLLVVRLKGVAGIGLVCAPLLLSGCAVERYFLEYRINVQQGNLVEQKQIAQLRPGMTRDQVRYVLGTPLLQDPFHADRWDYPFLVKRGDGAVTTSHVVVYFKEGRVASFDGTDLPDEKEYLRLIAAPKK